MLRQSKNSKNDFTSMISVTHNRIVACGQQFLLPSKGKKTCQNKSN